MLAEDADLAFRFYLAGYKIRCLNDVESYEEAVESWQNLLDNAVWSVANWGVDSA